MIPNVQLETVTWAIGPPFASFKVYPCWMLSLNHGLQLKIFKHSSCFDNCKQMNFHQITHRNNPTIPPFCQSLNNAFRGGEEGDETGEVGDCDSAGGVSAASSASWSSLVFGLGPEVGVGRRGMALALILALGIINWNSWHPSACSEPFSLGSSGASSADSSADGAGGSAGCRRRRGSGVRLRLVHLWPRTTLAPGCCDGCDGCESSGWGSDALRSKNPELWQLKPFTYRWITPWWL